MIFINLSKQKFIQIMIKDLGQWYEICPNLASEIRSRSFLIT